MIGIPANLPGTNPGDPMPPLLAVRALLYKHADVRFFDAEVEAALIEAARSGEFQPLREAIAGHLWSAISAEHLEEAARLPPAQRAALLRERMLTWIKANTPPPFKEFLQAQQSRTIEPLPDVEGPMRGFLTPADDEDQDPPDLVAAGR